jgi:hypothetical protein
MQLSSFRAAANADVMDRIVVRHRLQLPSPSSSKSAKIGMSVLHAK